MIKKIGYFLGGILFLLLILPHQAQAAEGECHLKHCLVPAPTILMPEDGETVTTTRPAIRALTWKTTVVKVFLDDVELKNVKQRKHEDYYGSIFVVPDFDLKPGDHYIYTIAYSEKPGWYDQSKESFYIDFTVRKISVAPVKTFPATATPSWLPPAAREPATSSAEIEVPSQLLLGEGATSSVVEITPPEVISNKEVEVVANQATGTVAVKEGRIEGGVTAQENINAVSENLQEAAGISDLGEILKDEFTDQEQQRKERNNRLVGLVMLGVILVVIIIWLIVGRQKTKKELLEKDEGELPPPPQPPKGRLAQSQAAQPKKDEEITIEPIQEEDLTTFEQAEIEDKYWASPPPSPYSPYPSTAQKSEGESKEKQEDLGI